MNLPPARGSRQRGITMVESLVALVVLSVGMLGIAGLYVSSLKAGRSALIRTQAVNLASDLADRIRANRKGLGAYATAGYGTKGPALKGCLGGDCSPAALAQDDLARWNTQLADTMPSNAAGTIAFKDPVFPAPAVYTITVSWRESGDAADNSCQLVVEL